MLPIYVFDCMMTLIIRIPMAAVSPFEPAGLSQLLGYWQFVLDHGYWWSQKAYL